MEDKGKRALIDRIEYFMNYPEDEHSLCVMFSQKEREILKTIRKFERIRYLMEQEDIGNDIGRGNDDITERVFLNRAYERDISFRLREQMIEQINELLKRGRIEAWMDILTWYQLLKGKDLIINKFWEFPVLGTILKAFKEELKNYYRNGNPIDVLSFHTMKELTDTYFAIVFLFRRIEYNVESVDELRHCFLENNFSFTLMETVLEDARIFDKRKVKRAIDSWTGKQNG